MESLSPTSRPTPSASRHEPLNVRALEFHIGEIAKSLQLARTAPMPAWRSTAIQIAAKLGFSQIAIWLTPSIDVAGPLAAAFDAIAGKDARIALTPTEAEVLLKKVNESLKSQEATRVFLTRTRVVKG